MNDALFLDASSLNALYKVNGKFSVAVNYADCPEQLVLDTQYLGNSFDIYISMWPRAKGEGDIELPNLSLGSVAFVALAEEVRALFSLVDQIPGVNNIYLCNALANQLIPARVSNYQVVLCAGTRYALVEVKDKHIVSCDFFAGQREFYDKMGEDFTCYGDVDLLDANTLKAQYPELEHLKRVDLVPLTALITSYRSTYKATMEEVLESIVDVKDAVPVEVEEEPAEEAVPPKPIYEDKPTFTPVKLRRGIKIDFVAAILVFVFCGVMGLNGFNYNLRNVGSKALQYTTECSVLEGKLSQYQGIQVVYDYGVGMAGQGADAMEYAKASGLAISISEMKQSTAELLIVFNCTDRELRDQFSDYLALKYTVLQVFEYGTSSNTDGTQSHRFGIALDVKPVNIPEE